MILVTVGSDDFDRLVQMVDELKGEGKIKDEIIAQLGNTPYTPKYIKNTFKFTPWERMNELSKKAKCVISAAGAGSILTTLRHGTPYIAVPKLKRLKEHVNDHQLELANTLQEGGKILVANNKKELLECLEKINRGWKPTKPTEKSEIRKVMKDYLESINSQNKKQIICIKSLMKDILENGIKKEEGCQR